jgi:catechol 2,3-dioxygenase-like lactoylglutathione lyase family enzyme
VGSIILDETNWNAAISWQLGHAEEREAPLKTSAGCHNTGIHHVGLRAGNPAASAEFYRDVFGMKIVGGSDSDHSFGASAFLSSRPDEESHEIALFANPAFAHIAFKVSSLAEFRPLYAHVIERSILIKFAANHHTSFAFYFDDLTETWSKFTGPPETRVRGSPR